MKRMDKFLQFSHHTPQKKNGQIFKSMFWIDKSQLLSKGSVHTDIHTLSDTKDGVGDQI
jgi:hypothetical protein